MKPTVKKILIIALVVCAVLLVIGIVSGDDEGSSSESTSNSNNNNAVSSSNQGNSTTAESTTDSTSTTKPDSTSNNKLGNYEVEIKGYRLGKDYENKPIVIIKYLFTNNDDEAAAFYLTFEDHVYQDGVGLNECYVVDDSVTYSSDNQTKEIKKGSSIEVEIAYVLNDTATDLEVEIGELISFSDKKITKVFQLAD